MRTDLLLIIGGVFLLIIFLALPPDARSMAVGVLFGLAAGVPAYLLVLAAQRRPRTGWALDAEEDEMRTLPVTVQGPSVRRIDHPMLRALPAPSVKTTAIQPYYIDPDKERRRIATLTSPEALARVAEEDGDVGEWGDDWSEGEDDEGEE